ncbi:hypothetical protein, partial [Actinoplanes sp. NPDC089786]
MHQDHRKLILADGQIAVLEDSLQLVRRNQCYDTASASIKHLRRAQARGMHRRRLAIGVVVGC